jgi:hypothetical protein
MGNPDPAASVGLTVADVAWPLVLALCVAFMIMPFAFLVLALRRPEEVHDDPD